MRYALLLGVLLCFGCAKVPIPMTDAERAQHTVRVVPIAPEEVPEFVGDFLLSQNYPLDRYDPALRTLFSGWLPVAETVFRDRLEQKVQVSIRPSGEDTRLEFSIYTRWADERGLKSETLAIGKEKYTVLTAAFDAFCLSRNISPSVATP